MNKFITIIAPLKNAKIILFSLILLYCSNRCTAQTGDSIKNIPSNVKQASQQKAVGKSNSVTKDALDMADSTSNKVFRSVKGMFKKKPHPPVPPTTAPATTAPPTTVPASSGPSTTAPPTTVPRDSTGTHKGATSMILFPFHSVITRKGDIIQTGGITQTGDITMIRNNYTFKPNT